MKRSRWMTILCILLVLCMTMQPVSAAGKRNSGNRKNDKTAMSENRWENNRKNSKGNQKEDKSKAEDELSVNTESAAVMTLVEDETTVENGDMLRASTYNLMTTADEGAETAEEGMVLKYFPVTLYDYDADIINAATDELDGDSQLREGIYFANEDLRYNVTLNRTRELVTYTLNDNDQVVFEDGTYAIYCTDTGYYIKDQINTGSPWGTTVLNGTGSEDLAAASMWKVTHMDDGSYTIQNEEDLYITITGNNAAALTVEETRILFKEEDSSGHTFTIYDTTTEKHMNSLGGNFYGTGYFGGWTGGSTFALYSVTNEETVSGYERWNIWAKGTNDNNNGQKTYTGLASNRLDVDKDIVFTKPQAGIFDSNTEVKEIYTDVEMPFVYEDGYYVFDSSRHGVYFKADEEQGSTANGEYVTDSTGTRVNPRLYFDKENPQGWDGMSYGDGSTNLWAPFNNAEVTAADVNYHFGMRATIPFSMTPNGRVVATNENSEPIKFSFSGDDDVWIFIDGQLVVDLGGIHNRLDAEIDFAANTVTYSESNSVDAPTGSFNDENFALEQKLFGNLITQDIGTFAMTDYHELTIFYLERGAGASNSKIQFNLPVNDAVVITKDATRSWSPKTEEISLLTEAEQEIVNNISFKFALYRSTDGGTSFERVANTKYYLLNSNNQVIATPTTSTDGYFYLKNGQSAKFITTQIDSSEYDVIYYVEEDPVIYQAAGFTDPDYNYSGNAADGFWYKVSGENVNIDQKYSDASLIPEYEVFDGTGASGKVTIYGSTESEDSIVFMCSNFMNKDLPNPSARPVEDKIVIDYGLPVEIDVLHNDVYRGDTIEVISVAGDGWEINPETGAATVQGKNELSYGIAELVDGKIKYTLTKPLSGVEVLNYIVKVSGETKVEATGEEIEAYEYGLAKVYIIPATTMYYEENFSDFVTYTGKYWNADYTVDSTYQNNYQEPGVVGTIDDSPYGSDVAYFNDSNDSNGTSRYACTTNSAVQFEYTFTGTGTTFFARSTNNSGYMRVVVKDADGNTIQTLFRNTVYKTKDSESAVLYNIPVFTTDELDYGTYTVTVTVAKENNKVGYHGEFWLDGIRVMQPLDAADANYSVAAAAYATDSEQNMTNVTLRNKLLREADYDEEGNPVWSEDGNFVLFTDVDGAIDTAEEYESIGPKEEVYLTQGQSVSFTLNKWNTNGSKVYLGMKAPMGSGVVTIGRTTLDVNNAADCYYEISNYAIITTNKEGVTTATFNISTTDGLIAVTNIKVTGDSEFIIIEESDKEVGEADGEDVEAGGDESGDIEIDGSEGEGSDLS